MKVRSDLNGRTIALLEDHAAVRNAMRGLLEACGAKVITYGKGSDILQDVPIVDCLILDYHLPGLGALDLLAGLRQQGFSASVIVFTAMSDLTLEQRQQELGINEIVDKASGTDELLQVVYRHALG
jgi:FixJ family two-component response regulator